MPILQNAGLRAVFLAAMALGLSGCAGHSLVARNRKSPEPAPTPTAMERQVRNAVDAGDGDYSLKQLRARLDADPKDIKARLELAAYYQHAGFPEVAIEHGRLACERAPDSVEAHLALAKLLRAEGKIAEATGLLGEFAAAHDASIHDVDVWAWLGLLRDEGGNWKAGEAAHRKAVALAPGRDDLRNNLGYCLLKQGRKAEAAEEFRAALRLNSQSVTARNNLGLAVMDGSDQKEAIVNWQSVSDAASAHNNMAVALIEAGKYAEARHELEIALSYNQQHSAALKNLYVISQLDGKAAQIAVPRRARSRFARTRDNLVRIWTGNTNKNFDDHSDDNSGSPVASR
jgi:Flp pilus assembly protein TadD